MARKVNWKWMWRLRKVSDPECSDTLASKVRRLYKKCPPVAREDTQVMRTKSILGKGGRKSQRSLSI
jgi:hypothetical protein